MWTKRKRTGLQTIAPMGHLQGPLVSLGPCGSYLSQPTDLYPSMITWFFPDSSGTCRRNDLWSVNQTLLRELCQVSYHSLSAWLTPPLTHIPAFLGSMPMSLWMHGAARQVCPPYHQQKAGPLCPKGKTASTPKQARPPTWSKNGAFGSSQTGCWWRDKNLTLTIPQEPIPALLSALGEIVLALTSLPLSSPPER